MIRGKFMEIAQVITAEKIAWLHALLSQAERVAIIAHARPDGDAIGSLTALAQILGAQGHAVVGIAPTPVPPALRWVAGFDCVKTYTADREAVRRALAEAQLCIHVDHNAVSRVDPDLEEHVQACHAPRVMIDHHVFPRDEQFALAFSFPESSSTCELLYELIVRAWGEEFVSPSVANSLYMGILTDTGSFAHACGRKRTFEVAGALVEKGADVPAIREHVFCSYTQSRYFLYGEAMASCTTFFAHGKAAIVELTEKFMQSHNFMSGDTEGLVNEPLTVAGVAISALLSERPDGIIRVSLRSRQNAEVNTIARTYLNGGGHPQASGGSLSMPLREAVQFVRLIITMAIDSGECFVGRG